MYGGREGQSVCFIAVYGCFIAIWLFYCRVWLLILLCTLKNEPVHGSPNDGRGQWACNEDTPIGRLLNMAVDITPLIDDYFLII